MALEGGNLDIIQMLLDAFTRKVAHTRKLFGLALEGPKTVLIIAAITHVNQPNNITCYPDMASFLVQTMYY